MGSDNLYPDTEITGYSSSLRSHRDQARSSVTTGKQMWELRASQSHLSSWESYGVSPLRMHFSGHMEEKVVTEKSQHGFATGKSCLTKSIAFCFYVLVLRMRGKQGMSIISRLSTLSHCKLECYGLSLQVGNQMAKKPAG